MKKKTILIIVISVLALIGALTTFRYYTKSHSPAAVAEYHQHETDVIIHYCQPSKKGRLIFGEENSGALQPYGKYWRIGANEATQFKTTKNLMVNNQELKAGEYSIYAYPGKETWEIVFNSDFDRWGVPAPDTGKDVLKTSISCANDAELKEMLQISLNPRDSLNLDLVIHWDQTMVTLPMTIIQ